jgi:hypothetical protein
VVACGAGVVAARLGRFFPADAGGFFFADFDTATGSTNARRSADASIAA